MKNVKIICPNCNNEFICKDFEKFILKLEEAWEYLKKHIKFDELPEEQQEAIKKSNSLSYSRELIKEKGYIKLFCLPCHILISWKSHFGDLKNETLPQPKG